MTPSEAFYQALNDYIKHFGHSPPAAFINAKVSTQSIQAKTDAMNKAVAANTPI